MRDLQDKPELLCMNTATLGFREPIAVSAQRIADAGYGWITPWRQEIDEDQPQQAAAAIRASGLKVSAYCRTTYLSGDTVQERQAAITSNKRALEVAAELGAATLVAVVGGISGQGRDIGEARQQILDGLDALTDTMRATGVAIALEPLHPYYAVDRSVLNTVAQALDWCQQLDPHGSKGFGIAVDAYHVWWDPMLAASIAAARGRIMALHVCDWLRQTRDPLTDRGMMGDGVIDLRGLRAQVEAAGYQGPVEVEIFSSLDWWQRDPAEILDIARERLITVC